MRQLVSAFVICAGWTLTALALDNETKDTQVAATTRTKKLQVKVTVEFQDTPLREALEELKKQVEDAGAGSLGFRYAEGVSLNQRLSYIAKNQTVAAVLDGMLQKNVLGYIVISKEKDRYDGWLLIKQGKERGYPIVASPSKPPAKESAKSKDKPPAEKPASESAKAEQLAAGKLKLAKILAEDGKLDRAKERYQDIIKAYPKTKAAEEARQLLDKLNQK